MFISTDITGPLSANMYAYCENNPVLYVDYLGKTAASSPLVGGKDLRDVTDEVDEALMKAMLKALTERIIVNALPTKFKLAGEGLIYQEFYNLVNHGQPWDIKIEDMWEKTIGTEFPGEGATVIYHGQLMTPEDIGNSTYGSLGRAYGIPLSTLIAGSYYAADFPTGGDKLQNEVHDWVNIIYGYQIQWDKEK